MFGSKLFARSMAATLATVAVPIAASTAEKPLSYVATYVYESGAKSSGIRELLTLRKGEANAFVSLSNANGAVLTTPTQFAADGEIEGDAGDPSVLCYNMAASTLYAHLHTPDKPGSVFVQAGDATVGIPVDIREVKSSEAGVRDFVGLGKEAIEVQDGDATAPAELIVEAKMRVVGGAFADVAFSEATAIGDASNVVNRQTCVLAAPGAPSAPAVDTATPATYYN